MNQEKILQMQIIEQEFNQFSQQLELIDQNILEMQELKRSLAEVEKDNSKEILASLGRGIYIPVEIKDKKLIVEIGKKNLIKKTIPETINLIEEQINKLSIGKESIRRKLEDLQDEIENIASEDEKNISEHKHSHECKRGHNHGKERE